MARETIEIPASDGPLHEAVAVFRATLAYPYDRDRDKRDDFWTALWREQVRLRAAQDLAFASQRQMIPPGLFLMSDAEIKRAMRDGGARLAERKVAHIATDVLFKAAESGQEISCIEAFGTKTRADAVGRAILAKLWEDGRWDKDGKSAAKNLGQREIKRSLPVIHAVTAYWRTVLECRSLERRDTGKRLLPTDIEAERLILHDRNLFEHMIRRAEHYRGLAPSIPELSVSEGDLIEFRLV